MMKLEKKKVNDEKVKEVMKLEVSKSEKMKQLFMLGMDVKSISEMLEVRYNFVYNVVSNMIRVEGIEDKVIKEVKEGKKDEIEKLLKMNKSLVDISRELKVNYNYVWKIKKEMIEVK